MVSVGTRLGQVEPRERAGAQTGRKYEYQYERTARAALDLLTDISKYVCVYCDWHDDYVVEIGDPPTRYLFHQVKGRKSAHGPWTFSEFFGVQMKKAKAPSKKPETDQQIARIDAALEAKRAERDRVINASPAAEVLSKLNTLTKELVDVELRLAKFQQYTSERQKFERLIDQREQAVALVADTRPTGARGASAAGDARQMLSDAMQQWLITLGTQNAKKAYFDEDFTLFVDDAKFATTTHQSGSTRTRIVLAFHAALLELSLTRGDNHPGWLLFDAPKQHELSQTDFDSYTDRLQTIAAKYPSRVQVVFSVADLKTQFQPGDEVWLPPFTVDGNLRFLGPASKADISQPPA